MLVDRLPPSIIAQIVHAQISDVKVSYTVYVTVVCECGISTNISSRALVRKWSKRPAYLCKSCSVRQYANGPNRIAKFQQSFTQTSQTVAHRTKCAVAGRMPWTDAEYRVRMSTAVRNDNLQNPKKIAARNTAAAAFQAMPHYRDHLDNIRKLAQATLRLNCTESAALRQKLALNFGDYDKEQHRAATRLAVIRRWQDPIYRRKMAEILNSPEVVAKLRANSLKLWANADYRAKLLAIRAEPEYRRRMSLIAKEVNSRPEVRLAKAAALQQRAGTSKLEDTFASLLDDLGITYRRQALIGWYTFDFILPSATTVQPALLVEINGDYFHSLPDCIRRDQQKASYITRYFSDQYCLRTIWEREFGSKDRVRTIVEEWLAPAPPIDFDMWDVTVEIATAASAVTEEVKLLLSKHHYLGKIGRWQLIVAFRHASVLIGAAVFTAPTRREMATRLGLPQRELFELSRFCLHPRYQLKNFASWALSRAMRAVPQHIRCLVTFADPAFGHSGTIYQASNWTFDGETGPSYFYRDAEGFVMHKRTLYGRARSLHMTEREFAEEYGYVASATPPKLRYVYWR